MRAAGGLLAGGHTIRDAEPKYGLAVVGTVHPKGIWPKNGARPGDALFLTKPLGTGLIMTGYKRGMAGTQQLERAIRWMRTLNNDAADVLRGARAERGHRRHRLRPLRPRARGRRPQRRAHPCSSRSASRRSTARSTLARKGVRTSGDPRNRDFAAGTSRSTGVPETFDALGYDPQTAGGLLVSLPTDKAPALEAEFEAQQLFLRRVGRVEEGAGVVVV